MIHTIICIYLPGSDQMCSGSWPQSTWSITWGIFPHQCRWYGGGPLGDLQNANQMLKYFFEDILHSALSFCHVRLYKWYSTFGGTSSSCLSQELLSNLSSRLVMRGGGAGVSDVGSEFWRGIGGRWGDRPSWKAETPWDDWSWSDWDPVIDDPWDFTETRWAICEEDLRSVLHSALTKHQRSRAKDIPEVLPSGAWVAFGPAVYLHCWRTRSVGAGRGRKSGLPLCAEEPENFGGSSWNALQPDRHRVC